MVLIKDNTKRLVSKLTVVDPGKVVSLKTPSKEILTNPKTLFDFLCQYTVPYGYEGLHYGNMLKNLGFTPDSYGNYFKLVSGKQSPKTAFMAHMDTSSTDFEKITKVRQGKWLGTDGRTNLGADDRAGMTAVLYLCNQNIPGLYCLFVGEEVGCVGSKFAATHNSIFQNISFAISFDRREAGSIITHQCGIRTCSEAFADRLSGEFFLQGTEMEPDPTGLFTDSMEFSDIVPECTNISVGYVGAHGGREVQDLEYLEKICFASTNIDWESLPCERDPSMMDIYIEDRESSAIEILEKIRLGFTVDLYDLYGFVTEHPDEAAVALDKLLRGYCPSNL